MKIQDYGQSGEIHRLGLNSYEVRTSYGTGKGSTVAEALKDLANQQAEESKAKDTSLNIQAEDVKQEPVDKPKDKPKKRKSSKKKKQTD